MKRFTFRKVFENFNSNKPTTTMRVDGHTEIAETIEGFFGDTEHFYLIGAAVDRLAEYEDEEERGLLLHLPCNPGDIVYRVASSAKNPIISMKVHSFTKYDKGKSFSILCTDFDDNVFEYTNHDIGKTVFLTKSNARWFLKNLRRSHE